MVIIVSGCDRTGKTTLCNKLFSRLCPIFMDYKLKYFHFSVPPNQKAAKKQYQNFIKCANDKTIYILDRFYECEMIYAPIYRNYSVNYCNDFDKWLFSKTNTLFIYTYSDVDIIADRMRKYGEDYIKEDDIQLIINNYNNYLKQIRLPYIIVNNNTFCTSNIDMCINAFEKLFINRQRHDDYKAFGNMQADKIFLSSNPYDINNIKDMWYTNHELFIEGRSVIND